ncbi:MAG: 50S ribosomal protein L18 [Patescibacteria group bacterium]|nr:50S ribosomal protein L18 [Patescibacteria group bacterium]
MKKIVTFDKKLRKIKKVREKIKGTKQRPRIAVFRSNRYIYAQAIDDDIRKTIATFSSLNLKKEDKEIKIKKTEEAKIVGLKLAELLKKKEIDKAVFDRRFYHYHGRVKALVNGLREGGIKI